MEIRKDSLKRVRRIVSNCLHQPSPKHKQMEMPLYKGKSIKLALNFTMNYCPSEWYNKEGFHSPSSRTVLSPTDSGSRPITGMGHPLWSQITNSAPMPIWSYSSMFQTSHCNCSLHAYHSTMPAFMYLVSRPTHVNSGSSIFPAPGWFL